jgi:hypothetical protein
MRESDYESEDEDFDPKATRPKGNSQKAHGQ